MLQVTIKDTKTNEFIFDSEVSMVIMVATEVDVVRIIRHTTKDASLSDVMNCVQFVKKAALEAKRVLSEAVGKALDAIDVDEDDE